MLKPRSRPIQRNASRNTDRSPCTSNETLRPVSDPLDQFGSIQLAVAHRLIVEELGLLVVQIESDLGFDAAFHAGLDEAADAQAGDGTHTGAAA